MSERPRIRMERDNDGGLTIHDPHSGIVLSVISSHPDAGGPPLLYVQAYPHEGGREVDYQRVRENLSPNPSFAFFWVEAPDA